MRLQQSTYLWDKGTHSCMWGGSRQNVFSWRFLSSSSHPKPISSHSSPRKSSFKTKTEEDQQSSPSLERSFRLKIYNEMPEPDSLTELRQKSSDALVEKPLRSKNVPNSRNLGEIPRNSKEKIEGMRSPPHIEDPEHSFFLSNRNSVQMDAEIKESLRRWLYPLEYINTCTSHLTPEMQEKAKETLRVAREALWSLRKPMTEATKRVDEILGNLGAAPGPVQKEAGLSKLLPSKLVEFALGISLKELLGRAPSFNVASRLVDERKRRRRPPVDEQLTHHMQNFSGLAKDGLQWTPEIQQRVRDIFIDIMVGLDGKENEIRNWDAPIEVKVEKSAKIHEVRVRVEEAIKSLDQYTDVGKVAEHTTEMEQSVPEAQDSTRNSQVGESGIETEQIRLEEIMTHVLNRRRETKAPSEFWKTK